jgi:hypothetical protein
MAIVWIIIIAGLPVVAIILRLFARDHLLTQYLTPQFLNRTDHTKVELCQSGTAWILWSGWLLLLPIAAVSQIAFKQLETHPIVMAMLFFIIPVTSAVLQIAGWILLVQGVFGRYNRTTPLVDSMFAADPEMLGTYIRRMWWYARVSMTTLALAILVPVSEAYLEVPPTGVVVLVNAFFLITFILTLWRTRIYVVKSCVAMSQSGREAFYSTVGSPESILFVWYNAYQVRQEYLDGNVESTRKASAIGSSSVQSHR